MTLEREPNNQDVVALVLAAGQGTRMRSELPKVLHPLLGRPMIAYPVEAALDAGCSRVVAVLGHGREAIGAELSRRFGARVHTTLQAEQLGTGHAARCGVEALPEHEGAFLVVYGDAPLLTAAPLLALIEAVARSGVELALLTSRQADATGYGRVIRDAAGTIVCIREQKDCSEDEKALTEWNPGLYCVKAGFFRRALAKLDTNNAQRELLLTDVVAAAARAKGLSDVPWPEAELHGVNDRVQLAEREGALRRRLNREHALRGVTIRDPESAYIEPDVTIEADAVIEPDVHLRGRCVIERGAHVDVGSVLRDVIVRAGARILPYTVATSSEIGARAQVGPFSHLRPSSELGADAHVGNFVETKKTRLGAGSKANHLAYLGDGVIGAGVNIGAGTIFCNYDGYQKHVTTLEDGVFVGSDSQLVAPVTVGKNAYVATGTTVITDVPPDGLAIGRARQANKEGLGKRLRERLAAQAGKTKK
jgi:bifunctional UDP-N-acetylglucosamine pyrophosphorylase/glucosamine-1-phosphate N-acetyltransferase